MTKQEIQTKYAGLALKLGDLTVKKWGIENQIAAIRDELGELDRQVPKETRPVPKSMNSEHPGKPEESE